MDEESAGLALAATGSSKPVQPAQRQGEQEGGHGTALLTRLLLFLTYLYMINCP